MDRFNEILHKIQDQVPTSYKWEKDDRFKAWLVVIEKKDSENVKEKISGIFASSWDSSTLGKASKPEKKVVKDLGGIEKGQIIFTIVSDDDVFFGAWWPWGDNSKISLRVGHSPA